MTIPKNNRLAVTTGSPLAKLADATRMLAEVRDAKDAKKLMDLASAAEHYAKKARLGEESIQYAHEIKVDAETLLGEFLAKAEKNKGARGIGKSGVPLENPTLNDLGLSKKESSEAQLLAKLKVEAPEKHAAVRNRKKSKTAARKEVRATTKRSALELAATEISSAAKKKLSLVCDLRHCTSEELFASGITPDAVITDPPYPKEFLPLYGALAKACKSVPLVAIMCGQSYLPDIISAMCEHLTYRWMLAYLTPGGQAAQQWVAKMNSFWKPVLLFGEALDWIGDVSTSATNDNDKRFHGWGQSESGMADLVARLTQPGMLVCDPFLGGGTTATVSLALGRRFVGCDVDKECVDVTTMRLEASYAVDA